MIHFHSKQILLYQLLCIVIVKYDINLKFYAKDLMKKLEQTEVFLKHTAEKFDQEIRTIISKCINQKTLFFIYQFHINKEQDR
jgi:hypothetical protein